MRIAYPVILLGWIANPAQREQQGDTEHPPRQVWADTLFDKVMGFPRHPLVSLNEVS